MYICLNRFCENGTLAAIAQHFPGQRTLIFCFTSTPRKVKTPDAPSSKTRIVLTDEQKERKRSKDRQRRRDQRVSEKLRVDEIASHSAKNDRMTKRLSDVMQPAPKIDDVECESPAPVPLPEPQGAVRSTGTESDDNDDGDDEINDGTYVGSSEKVMDATNVLQKLHHARSEDKSDVALDGRDGTLFLRTTTNVSKPAGPEAAGTPGSCRHNLCFETHTRAAFGRQ
jgi:hypothetical protein